METITEDYVSFETAKLLKEKGFDVPCNCYGAYNGVNLTYRLCITNKFTNWNKHTDERIISCPTLQMAMKWLREVHNIHIELNWDKGNQLYSFQIWKPRKYNPEISSLDLWRVYKDDSYLGEWDYEQACETAIKYCLEHLIK